MFSSQPTPLPLWEGQGGGSFNNGKYKISFEGYCDIRNEQYHRQVSELHAFPAVY